MLRILPGHPEIWKQLQGVWEMIDVDPMKAWYSVFNRNTESVTMKQWYLRSAMRLVGCK